MPIVCPPVLLCLLAFIIRFGLLIALKGKEERQVFFPHVNVVV